MTSNQDIAGDRQLCFRLHTGANLPIHHERQDTISQLKECDMIKEYRMALEDYEKKRNSLRDSRSRLRGDNKITLQEVQKFIEEVEVRYIKEVRESGSQRRITRSMVRLQGQSAFKLTYPEERDDLKFTLEERGIHHPILKARDSTLTWCCPTFFQSA